MLTRVARQSGRLALSEQGGPAGRDDMALLHVHLSGLVVDDDLVAAWEAGVDVLAAWRSP